MNINNIAVIGAGVMGHGIAESFAIHGYQVCLYVVETASEVPEVKQKIFGELDSYCGENTILATNTSSLKLSDIIENLPVQRKKNCMVCHWFNPAYLMPLVELSFYGNMTEETYQKVHSLYMSIGKIPVKVIKEIPGLVANRIQQAIARETFSLMEREIASPEDIDRALTFGPAFRYAATGQLEIADMGGLDIWCKVGDNLIPELDHSQGASRLLREKVEAGKLGIKSGEGFYVYNRNETEDKKRSFEEKLLRQLRVSMQQL